MTEDDMWAKDKADALLYAANGLNVRGDYFEAALAYKKAKEAYEKIENFGQAALALDGAADMHRLLARAEPDTRLKGEHRYQQALLLNESGELYMRAAIRNSDLGHCEHAHRRHEQAAEIFHELDMDPKMRKLNRDFATLRGICESHHKSVERAKKKIEKKLRG